MVTVRPAGVWLDRRTMAAWPAVKADVSTSTTDVLAVTIYDAIAPSIVVVGD